MNLLSSLKAEAKVAVQERDDSDKPDEKLANKQDAKPAEDEKPSQNPKLSQDNPLFRDVADHEKMQQLFDESPTNELNAGVANALLQAVSESRGLFNSGLWVKWSGPPVLPNPNNFRKAAKGLNGFSSLLMFTWILCACYLFLAVGCIDLLPFPGCDDS